VRILALALVVAQVMARGKRIFYSYFEHVPLGASNRRRRCLDEALLYSVSCNAKSECEPDVRQQFDAACVPYWNIKDELDW
jgi:hypothetical protein